jgi:hypothetical protein
VNRTREARMSQGDDWRTREVTGGRTTVLVNESRRVRVFMVTADTVDVTRAAALRACMSGPAKWLSTIANQTPTLAASRSAINVGVACLRQAISGGFGNPP